MHSNQRCIIKVRASPVRGIGLPWSSVRFPSPSGRGVELPCPNSASFARPRAQILKPVKKKKIKREIKILQNLSGGPNVVQARPGDLFTPLAFLSLVSSLFLFSLVPLC